MPPRHGSSSSSRHLQALCWFLEQEGWNLFRERGLPPPVLSLPVVCYGTLVETERFVSQEELGIPLGNRSRTRIESIRGKTSCYFRALGRSAKAAAVVYYLFRPFFCARAHNPRADPQGSSRDPPLGRALSCCRVREGYPPFPSRRFPREEIGRGDCHRRQGRLP